MRLKSSIFVSALIRTEENNGAFCTILHKGDEDAGAIYIMHVLKRDCCDFYAPAPQSFTADYESVDRLFEQLCVATSESEVTAIINRQREFDPDCWVVEIEGPNPLKTIQLVQA